MQNFETLGQPLLRENVESLAYIYSRWWVKVCSELIPLAKTEVIMNKLNLMICPEI